VAYTWANENIPHEGVISLAKSGLSLHDAWHQTEEVPTERVPNAASLATVHYTYAEERG
jgi:hypothetical protein